MTHCPACHHMLTEVRVGDILVDVCQGGCGGLWFDAFELQRLGNYREAAEDFFAKIERDPLLQVDTVRKRSCPRCDDIKLKRRFFSAKRVVEIDECPNCAGLWLDYGELFRIREEMEEARAQAELRQPQLTTTVIRYLYQARLAAAEEAARGQSGPS